MPKNELFEKIANQSLKLNENDDDNSSFLNKIHNKLIDLFNYLYNQFEPNFPDYIAYCFEIII